jgi:hypothetical protein
MRDATAEPLSAASEDAIIAGLYRAAHGQMEWRQALDPVAQLTNSWVVQVLGIDLATQGVAYTYEGGWSKSDAVVEYVRKYHALDPHLRGVLQNEPGDWWHSSDHFDNDAVAVHPYYQEFLLPFGHRYVSGTKVFEDECSIVVFAAIRALGTPEFPGRGSWGGEAVLMIVNRHLSTLN